MLQETMKTVEEAEAKADEKIKAAKAEAESIIAEAEKKADDIVAAAGTDSKTGMAKVTEEQHAMEKELSDKALKDAATEIGSLKKKASEKEKEAIDALINELV